MGNNLQDVASDRASFCSPGSLQTLAATLAHEIRNPLAGISGAMQVVADGLPPENPHRGIIGEVLAQVRRLEETVRDLLIFASPAPIQIREVDLVSLVHGVVNTLNQADRCPGVTFRVEAPPSVIIPVDPALMREAAVNILQNAADASVPGSVVHVKVTETPGQVLFRVRDSGTGITPEVRKRLFKPFFTTKTRGTGLGLAISRQVVETHGGTIEIDSEPGKGTEVRIVLPTRPAGITSNNS